MGRNKRKNKIVENVLLTTAGAKGVAIGKNEAGKKILVKGGVPGDNVKAVIRKSKSNYDEADLLEITTPSDYRIDPICKHFGTCGGCIWQNMSYEKQLEFKQNEVVQNLKKFGGISDFEVLPILGATKPYFYRNKMEFSFSNSRWLSNEEIEKNETINSRNALGFHIPGMWSKILNLDECHLQESPSNEIRLAVKQFAETENLDFFDVKNQSGFLRTLMLRQNSKGQWMVLFQLFREEKENQKKLFDYILEKFPEITTLLFAINNKSNDSIYDLNIQKYYGDGFLMEEIDGLKFKIGPKSFFQTNYEQALELYRKTIEFADFKGNEVVYDLYTGTGTIAQLVAKKAKTVIGIESVQEAIDAANEHSELNGLKNITFYCGDMKAVFTDKFLQNHPKADILITDPPRDGMHPKVVEQILKLAPEKIVYVSCNSATQARDISVMKSQYNLIKILPIDMFPQTHHVENIALLKKI